jgi:hypothetical protein
MYLLMYLSVPALSRTRHARHPASHFVMVPGSMALHLAPFRLSCLPVVGFHCLFSNRKLRSAQQHVDIALHPSNQLPSSLAHPPFLL